MCWKDFTSADLFCVRWSPAKPSMFFVLDSNSTIFGFDLLGKNVMKPVLDHNFADKVSHVTSFEVSLSTPAAASLMGENNLSCLEYSFTLTYSDSKVVVSKFNPELAPEMFATEQSEAHKETSALLSKFHNASVNEGREHST
mmetsp:Transcript_26296/g.49952  ORF Transcript_26296/g.49952 Transcript_26296/m.49952 type:complete len:142 (-) Transcript_26296:238-663(-)